MQLVFGWDLDGDAYPETVGDAAAVGAAVLGPAGLIDVLERWLGLGAPAVSQSLRIAQYLARLREDVPADAFFAGSLEVDGWATARELLGWRDALVAGGWRGGPIADVSPRLRALEALEQHVLPHMLAVTNMLLHNVEDPSFVRHDNTLARPYISYTSSDHVDIVLTNPPFGGREEDGIESNFPTHFRTRETADLFLALIIRLLKPGGRAAVVLPDGSLFGEGVKTRLKEHLMEECDLHTIVRLPNSVFRPYASIGTNLLFFEKGRPTETIWYWEHRVPEGQKAYSMTRPIRLEHLQDCIDWWGGATRQGREPGPRAWQVTAEEVKARTYNRRALEHERQTLFPAGTGEGSGVDAPGAVRVLLERLKMVLARYRLEARRERKSSLLARLEGSGGRCVEQLRALVVERWGRPDEDVDRLVEDYRAVVAEVERLRRLQPDALVLKGTSINATAWPALGDQEYR